MGSCSLLLIEKSVYTDHITMPFKLVYWALPARAYPMRCLLHYYGIDFEDVGLPLDKPEQWGALKQKLADEGKLLYPNLPHIQDGDNYISESLAVMKFCARKAKALPKTEREEYLNDMFEGYYTNIFNEIVKTGSADAEAKAAFKANEPWKKLAPIEKHLGLQVHGYGGKFVCGECPLAADFFVATLFRLMCKLNPATAEHCPQLKTHTDRLMKKEGFKKYYCENDCCINLADWSIN